MSTGAYSGGGGTMAHAFAVFEAQAADHLRWRQ